jgi:hypothetical protein
MSEDQPRGGGEARLEHFFFPAGNAGVPMSLFFKQSLFMSTDALLLGEI